jgi:hypothetical protein
MTHLRIYTKNTCSSFHLFSFSNGLLSTAVEVSHEYYGSNDYNADDDTDDYPNSCIPFSHSRIQHKLMYTFGNCMLRLSSRYTSNTRHGSRFLEFFSFLIINWPVTCVFKPQYHCHCWPDLAGLFLIELEQFFSPKYQQVFNHLRRLSLVNILLI